MGEDNNNNNNNNTTSIIIIRKIIIRKMSHRNPFEILGISRSNDSSAAAAATERDVRDAFKRLAKELHPDRNKSSTTSVRNFQALIEARDEALRRISSSNNNNNNTSAGYGHYSHHDHSHHHPMGASTRGRGGSRVSHTIFALALPFIFAASFIGSHDDARRGKYGEDLLYGRVNGVLEPPVNPFLREDLKSTTFKSPTFKRMSAFVSKAFGY